MEGTHSDGVTGSRSAMLVSAAIAVAGAIACLLLVRRTDRVTEGPIFSRRSRWVSANVGRTPAVTRHPPPPFPETPPG
jgi:hypothetical protein